MFFLQKVFLKGTARRNGCFAKIKKNLSVYITYTIIYACVFKDDIYSYDNTKIEYILIGNHEDVFVVHRFCK